MRCSVCGKDTDSGHEQGCVRGLSEELAALEEAEAYEEEAHIVRELQEKSPESVVPARRFGTDVAQ